MSGKSKSTAFLLCYFLGILGVHRFYLRKTLTGIVMLFTLGGLFIWWLVDAVLIAAGVMKDRRGRPLHRGPPDPRNPQAGFWVRLAAISVDGVILQLIVSVLVMGLTFVLPLLGLGAMGMMGPGGMAGVDEGSMVMLTSALTGIIGLIALLAIPLYFGIQTASRHQATIGKRCFGIQVTAGDGKRVGLVRALWRSVAYLLSAIPLYLGFVVAAFTPGKRALHDYLAGTHVRYVDEAGVTAAAAPSAAMVDQEAITERGSPVGPAPAAAAAGAGDTRGAAVMMLLGAVLLAGAAAMAMLG